LNSLPITDIVTLVVTIACAGAIAGFLAGVFGIGGGAILVPVFYQAFGLAGVDEAIRMHLSVGTSLAIIVPTSLRSFARHRARGTPDMTLLRQWLFPVPFGVVLATMVIASVSGAGLRLIFAVIAVLVAMRLIFGRAHWQLGSDIPSGAVRSLTGVFIGFVSALMGIGGGVLNNTFMTLFGRPIHQAVATSAGTGVLISIPGLVGAVWAGWGVDGLPLFSTGYVNWICVALIIPITIAVAPFGADFAHRMEKRKLELAFGLFLLVVAARFVISVAL